jgi:hypothetical protein
MALEDLINWLRSLCGWFASLPRPSPLKGILDLSDEACAQTISAANSNIRATVTRGILLEDESVKEAIEHFPDICVLAEIVFSGAERTNVFELMDKFRENCEDWHAILDERDGKNRKAKRAKTGGTSGSNADASGTSKSSSSGAASNGKTTEDNTLRCRFVCALNGLERAGIVRLRQGSHEVTRLTWMWMS